MIKNLLKTAGILLMMMVVGSAWGQIFITELADPNNAAGARFVELYNAGASNVDLSTGYDLQRWTNENPDPQAAVELTGTIAAGGFYVVCANQTTFTNTYGFAADQDIGTGGPADSNGDDQIALRDPSDAIIDMFGVVGEDGSGTNHEFEDGRAERKATVTAGNTTYTFTEWNIWNDTGDAGTTNLPQDAPDDFDPGAWIGAPTTDPLITVSTTSLTGFSYLFGNGPSAEQTFTVEGSNLTNNISIAASTNYEISKSSGTGFTTPLTYTPAQVATPQTVYVRLKAGLSVGNYNSEDIIATSTGASNKTVTCSGAVTAPLPKIFISEYIEGSSNNKAFEIYNGESADINLSDVTINLYSNGSPTVSSTWTGLGTLAPGKSYIICNGSANTEILDLSDESGAAVANFNGDDALEVVYNGETTDILGVIGQDPGTAWDVSGTTDATAEHTLLRKLDVIQGTTDWSISAGTNSDNSQWVVESQDYTGNLGAFGTGWKGTTDTDWTASANWDLDVPGSTTNVLVNDVANDPLISGASTINDLMIKASGILSVGASNSLTVYGDIVNNASEGIILVSPASSGATGSLLIEGSISGSGTIKAERFIDGYTSSSNGWHLLSSPTDNFVVTGSNLAPSSVEGEEDDLYYWDNAQGDAGMWMNWKASNFNLDAGKGYLVAYKDTEVKDFVGSPYNADITLTNLSFANASPTYNNTWHLIGNPYTCALNWNNSNGWNLNNIGGVAKVMNVANGSYNDVNVGGSIPAMQGFFVEVVNASNSMTIPLAAREHSSQNWYKSQEGRLVLVANDLENNLAQASVIIVNNQSNGGYDYRFDSRFLGFYAPQFYSQKDGQQLSTNALPELTSDLSIPMGFVKNEASDFNIELKETISGTDVYLTDLKLNRVVKLSQEITYNFTSEEGDDPDRFEIHFGVVGIDESHELNQINAYVYNNSLYVQSQLDNAQMAMYDIQGRQMLSEQLNGTGLHSTELNLPTGIYIVRLQSNNQVKNVKVFIN